MNNTRQLIIAFCLGAPVYLAGQPAATATNSFTVANSGFTAYVINGQSNPDLTLVRGSAYTFDVATPGHPFWIKEVQGAGAANAYNSGVTGNGTASGTVTFTEPFDAPSLLYYNCQFHPAMTGLLNVEDPPPPGGADIVLFEVGETRLDLAWTNGVAPYQAQWRSSLLSGSWSNLGASTFNQAQSTDLPPSASVVLQVLGGSGSTLPGYLQLHLERGHAPNELPLAERTFRPMTTPAPRA